MADKKNVTDESGPTTGDDSDASFVKGYQSSTPESAMSPKQDSYYPYRAPGEGAVALKAKWKGKPYLFPNGDGGDSGTL